MGLRAERTAHQLKVSKALLVRSIRECLDAGFEKDEVALILRIPQSRAEEVIDKLLGD